MLKVLSPYDQRLIKEIPLVGKEAVEKALNVAYGLFTDQSKWILAHERIAVLERTISIMNDRVEELTKQAAHEGGKPYRDSKVEVLRAWDTINRSPKLNCSDTFSDSGGIGCF